MAHPSTTIEPANQEKRHARLWRWACLGILLLSIVVYSGALRGAPVWEDHRLMESGESTLAETFTKPFLGVYFRPLISLSFWVDYRLWHEEPFMFHQTNILIHALTTLALMGFLRSAFRSRRVALLGGLLFAVQPAQVSTVAWIGGRTDSLSTLLVALFGWTLVLGVRARRARAGWLASSALIFFLAMLAKEQTIALLPLVPLAFRCFGGERGPESKRQAWLWTVPFVAAGALFLLLAYTVGPGLPPSASHDWLYKISLCGRTITYYTLLLLTPSAQWMHSVTVVSLQSAGVLSVISGYLILAMCGLLFASLLRRAPSAAWFIALSVLALVPVFNLVPLGSLIVAPFRAGTAGLGVAALMGWGLSLLAGWVPERVGIPTGVMTSLRHESARISAVLLVAFFGWSAYLTIWGAFQWDGNRKIFETISRWDPMSSYANEGYIGSVMDAAPSLAELKGQRFLTLLFRSDNWKTPETAAAAFASDRRVADNVHASNGDKRPPRAALADTFTLLGYSRALNGDRPGALVAFRTGEAIDPSNGSINMAIGRWFVTGQRWREAIPYLQKVVKANKRIVSAFVYLGMCYDGIRDYDKAIASYRASIPLQPWVGKGYVLLAEAQVRSGDRAGAIATLEAGLLHASFDGAEVKQKLAELNAERTTRF